MSTQEHPIVTPTAYIPAPAVMSETAAALYLNLSAKTLQRMRRARRGPDFIRLGSRRIAFRRADLDAWLAAGINRPVQVTAAA